MTTADGSKAPRASFWRMLGKRPDGTILRLVFHGLIGLTAIVLGYDLLERMQAQPADPLLPGEIPKIQPFLPSVRPDVAKPDERDPDPDQRAALQQPMVIELVANGRLEATGTIVPGTAERFRAEIEKRGDYVKAVVLNSPGGSVQDALAMGRIIRERKLNTRVEARGYCASSCPLVLAGGVERSVEQGASVGVHQIFAVPTNAGAPAVGMAAADFGRAQQISAECQRHLVDMGVDPQVWIHAMETPPERIFYFTPQELTSLKLATSARALKRNSTAAKTP
ncbi:hypothetical protein [Rhodoligotrophos ferricapiens]|uniref:COG3904 family protein n=1 Tax=Rhodoligotrophos ferricapiens TaxID=3069264 RepID=UPI00315D7C59